MSELKVFKLLAALALVSQGMIDLGGYRGWYYFMYPQEVFAFAGYDSMIPFEWSFPLYLFSIFLFYFSLLLMFAHSEWAKPTAVATIILTLFYSCISGISIGTPHQTFFSLVAWTAYIGTFFMALYAPSISDRLKRTVTYGREQP